jgi:hypothetical protein
VQSNAIGADLRASRDRHHRIVTEQNDRISAVLREVAPSAIENDAVSATLA